MIALIVAGGNASRFKDSLPKPYHLLAGKPLLSYSLQTFVTHPEITHVQVVIRPEDRLHYEKIADHFNGKLLPPVHGGKERQESVRFGLEALSEVSPTYVLIHDAARPLVDHNLIDRVMEGLSKFPGVIPAIPVTDTLKKSTKRRNLSIERTIDRADLWQAQTPQGFDYKEILSAHIQCQDLSLTDDASVCETQDIPVGIVEGAVHNIKITTKEDWARVQLMLQNKSAYRTGQGFDVHPFKKGDHVILGGIKIPFEKSLKGHSDADVVLHALIDALLGAFALGDIGLHFPPSDDTYKNADSAKLLQKTMDLVREKGGEVVNVDITVICQAPKIGPHRAEIIDRIADILSILPDQVSIKATTTEGLGFTGRREGIAAQAIATVQVL